MLEIIILIFLSRYIGDMAVRKGQKPGTWKWRDVLGWFGGEILGILIGVLLGLEMIAILLLAYGLAVAGYHIVRNQLAKLPDITDDIEQLGSKLEY